MRNAAQIVLLSVSLSGCALYRPVPLPPAPPMTAADQAVTKHKFTLTEVASQAVLYSPDLVAKRRQADVAGAQAYAAGLLPDPQLSASADQPTATGMGLVTGYALGLSQDLQALLTEPSRASAAKAKVKEAKLNMLWAEWQTIQNAANLYTQKYYADRKTDVLARTAHILNTQSARSMRALSMHNSTIDVAGSDLSAALDISSQRDAAARAALQASADLTLLLNRMPETQLTLSDPGVPPPVTKQELEKGLVGVTHERPDLLALQAGYHAQEESVRTAILEQFPAINFGYNRASDTSNIHTNGLSVSLNIPIFGNVQAKIHTERATRAQLRAEYALRLDQTRTDAWRTWHALNLLRAQIDRLDASVPKLRHMAKTGQNAYDAGNLAPATYVLLQTSLSAREGELLDLKATLWADTIALRTLLAMSPIIPDAGATK